MKNFIIHNSLVFIKNNNPNYNDTDLEEIRYGLASIYIFITKLIVIMILAYCLNMVKELLLFMIIYSGIRAPSFGLHATKSWICLISSTIVFIGLPLTALHLNLPLILKSVIGCVCICLMFKNSPADTKKKPIVSPKRRLTYRYISTMIAIIYTTTSIFMPSQFLSNIFIFALVTQCVMISPLVYQIFKLPYNNYKAYLLRQDS